MTFPCTLRTQFEHDRGHCARNPRSSALLSRTDRNSAFFARGSARLGIVDLNNAAGSVTLNASESLNINSELHDLGGLGADTLVQYSGAQSVYWYADFDGTIVAPSWLQTPRTLHGHAFDDYATLSATENPQQHARSTPLRHFRVPLDVAALVVSAALGSVTSSIKVMAVTSASVDW